ncbi:MAG: condensation domain-containing protein [Vicinamibacterales bacterium]
MTTRAWFESLALAGWRFWMEDGRLRYRAPAEAATPEVLDRLRGERAALIALLEGEPDALAIAPLSWGQRALWFLWKLAPGSTAYHQSMPLVLPAGAREIDWRAAAAAVVTRHEMLRTCLPERAGAPIQRVIADPPFAWDVSDARSMDDGGLGAAMAASHDRPFDLALAPPIRFHWFERVTPVLLVTMHHVACDAWSLEVLRRDLADAAAAHAAHRPWSPPPLEATYTDFVRWQEAMLAGEEGARHWAYWRDALAAPRAALDLPLDRPRPAVQTYDGASVPVEWPDRLARDVRRLAGERHVTTYTVLLAAFVAFLHRLTRQHDVIVGTPTAGRTQPEFAGVVGYFVEPLPIRVRIDEHVTFDQVLDATRQAVGGAMAHADFPFPLLVERLQVDRDPGRSPIFDVTFNHLSRRAQAAGGAPSSLAFAQADGKFDLTLTVIEDDGHATASLGFNTSLFHPSTIERWGAALVHLVSAAVARPDSPVAELPLDAGRIVGPVFEGRTIDIASLPPVHETIAAVAAREPTRMAVVAPDGALTYGELLRRATALAGELQALGVGPDVPVGLRTGRSVDFITGLLGILMADGAFVPLDPDQPSAVTGRALERAGAVAVVERGGVTRRDGVAAGPPAVLDPADRLAYVIFTSGSTGEPKGVGVPHRALANYVASIVDDLAIQPGANHAFVSSLAADLGHTVLFPALTTGGTLHLLSAEAITDRRAFADAMRAGAIDYLKIVPSHLAALVDPRAPALPARGLFLGGESSRARWVEELVRERECRVFNHYGPTETTVGVMTGEWRAADADGAPALTLARAVANTRIWLLDERCRPVPAGLPGEIWVSGTALARGYLGDPGGTAGRFVELPEIGRAYRTGDVARVLPDGRLLVGGRADRQVKLRGYRVDPAQVESVLAGLPGVRQASVLPDADGPAASVLLAWVAMEAEAFDAQALREQLAAILPPYMVPSRVMRLDRLPVTANGKLDTHALRSMIGDAGHAAAGGPARDVLELRLSRIWSETVGAREIGIHDDFFEIGGHSLRAVQVASRIYDELGVRLPLATFFTARTVAALADVIRARGGVDQRLVPLQPRGTALPLVCFPGAGGGLLYFQDLAAACDPVVPLWGTQAPIGPEAPADVPALAVLFADALAGEPRIPEPYRLAGHSFGALVAYETAAVLRARGAAVERVIVLDNPAPGATLLPGQADWDEARWSRHIAARIERLYGVDLGLAQAGDAGGDPDWLLERLLETDTLPAGTSRDYFRGYVEGYKGNVKAAGAYRPARGPLDVPLLIVRAGDRDVAIDVADASAPDLGWSPFSSAGVRAIVAPGTHISMLMNPRVRTLARHLFEVLAATAPPAGGEGRHQTERHT